MIIRHSKLVLLVFLSGFGLILVAFILDLIGVIHIQGASTWIVRGFIFFFVAPAFTYFCFLWLKRDIAILSLSENELELRSGIFLNRTIRIPRGSIEKVTTNWKGSNTDSFMDLIFLLSEDASTIAAASSVLKSKADGWHFDLSGADVGPLEAVQQIKACYAI